MKKLMAATISILMISATILTGVMAVEPASVGEVGINGENGFNASFSNADQTICTVSYNGAKLAAGQQYVIMMVEGTEDSYSIDQDSILYIDQKAAVGSSKGAEVSFQVYPSEMKPGIVLLSGEVDGVMQQIVVATVEDKAGEEYILGDVNGDKVVDNDDYGYVLRYLFDYTDNVVIEYADVDKNGRVDNDDYGYILRYLFDYDDNLGIGEPCKK